MGKISMQFKYKEWYAIMHALEVQIEKRQLEVFLSEGPEKEVLIKDIKEEKIILRDVTNIINTHKY